MRASPEQVFAELADGWAFASWVVGATHIRAVDRTWPDAGSAIHHQIGVWPAVISDVTQSIECEPGRRLLLKAKAWPVGEWLVELVLAPQSTTQTMVTMQERPGAGPARWFDNPVSRWALRRRNVESLHRLRDRAEGRRAREAHDQQ